MNLPVRRLQAGQSMVETLVVAALVTALLAMPIDGSSSVVALMLAAIKTAFSKFLSAIALPV
ncbi:hypothetical protein LNV23_16410 [Paucibacter sp. DJ1R-11]|uniref:hypothetical protein n=1 Tax=Paucibacter sp. DJ1R-11 TaxID=2893556 RepID=UPI0021E3B51C|nr:hypothetical protein [Paucibacter sp. DJ1R-11]MCV2365036.1 hypothetical protein [Paucibacter sp. DJ1R-11]